MGYFTGIKGMKMKLIPPITAEVNVSSSFNTQVCHTDVVFTHRKAVSCVVVHRRSKTTQTECVLQEYAVVKCGHTAFREHAINIYLRLEREEIYL